MKELIEYRINLTARLEQAAREFVEACKARDAFANIEGSDWTVHQIAFHTRDVDKLVYGARIQKTLREDNPKFENFDADSWMSAHYDKEEPLDKILNEFLKSITKLRETLLNLPNEVWSRESRHASLGGGQTLQLWVESSLAHVEEHLKALK